MDLLKAIEINPNNDADNYQTRGNLYEELENYKSALADYSKAIEIEPDNAYSYYYRGGIYQG